MSMAISNIAEAEKTKAAIESAVATAIAEQKRLHEEQEKENKKQLEAEQKKISEENEKVMAQKLDELEK